MSELALPRGMDGFLDRVAATPLPDGLFDRLDVRIDGTAGIRVAATLRTGDQPPGWRRSSRWWLPLAAGGAALAALAVGVTALGGAGAAVTAPTGGGGGTYFTGVNDVLGVRQGSGAAGGLLSLGALALIGWILASGFVRARASIAPLAIWGGTLGWTAIITVAVILLATDLSPYDASGLSDAFPLLVILAATAGTLGIAWLGGRPSTGPIDPVEGSPLARAGATAAPARPRAVFPWRDVARFYLRAGWAASVIALVVGLAMILYALFVLTGQPRQPYYAAAPHYSMDPLRTNLGSGLGLAVTALIFGPVHRALTYALEGEPQRANSALARVELLVLTAALGVITIVAVPTAMREIIDHLVGVPDVGCRIGGYTSCAGPDDEVPLIYEPLGLACFLAPIALAIWAGYVVRCVGLIRTTLREIG